MANNRVYYAILGVGLARMGSEDYIPVHGLQSATLDLNFALEHILEIGQLETYESKEDVPEVSVTLEKVLDGYPLIYHLATRGFSSNTFAGRQNQRCSAAFSVFGDTQSSASGVPIRQIVASGLYYSSMNYTFGADGNFTESVTLVGNNLSQVTSNFTFQGSLFDNADQPLALSSGLGGVQRRQDFLWGSDGSIIPQDIPGVSVSGTNLETNGQLGAHIESITVSVDLGREQIVELGRLVPYFRYATVPVEVNTEITVISTEMHSVQAVETSTSNLTDREIVIKTRDGTVVDLGNRNKLTSVSMTGASTDGTNQTVTYSYQNLNSITITHPQDPTV